MIQIGTFFGMLLPLQGESCPWTLTERDSLAARDKKKSVNLA